MTNRLNEILVVSDVDGTLLQAGFGIPRNNIDTIERFSALGGNFTFASGRGITSAGKYTDIISLSAPAILVNGGIIYDYAKRKILYESTLDPSVRIILKEIMEVFPYIGVEVLSRENIAAIRMNNEIHNHTAVEHLAVTLTGTDTVGDGWNKVLFADTPENIGLLKNYVEKQRKRDSRYGKFAFVQTSNIYYELIPPRTNKATGLVRLAEYMGIKMENTIAIGDFYNDLELLNAAGLSVVVDDAPADIKKHADMVVAPCLAGGVAELLNSLIDSCTAE